MARKTYWKTPKRTLNLRDPEDCTTGFRTLISGGVKLAKSPYRSDRLTAERYLELAKRAPCRVAGQVRRLEHALSSAGPSEEFLDGLGVWRSPKRTTSRKRLVREGRSMCFLDPKGTGKEKGRPRYFICENGLPSCKGLRAARSRAILQHECGIERKAIKLAKQMGCQWSKRSKVPRRRVCRK